jgi:hypothetical protein
MKGLTRLPAFLSYPLAPVECLLIDEKVYQSSQSSSQSSQSSQSSSSQSSLPVALRDRAFSGEGTDLERRSQSDKWERQQQISIPTPR